MTFDLTLFKRFITSLDVSSGTNLSLPPVITSVSDCISEIQGLASYGTTNLPPSL